MMMIAVISLAISAVALLVSLGSVYYTRRQTVLTENDREERRREAAETAAWAAKREQAVGALLKIMPLMIRWDGDTTTGSAYPFIFPDPALHQRIEGYLIEAEPGRNLYRARTVEVDQLRLPVVRQTIEAVLARFKTCKETEPHYAQQLGL